MWLGLMKELFSIIEGYLLAIPSLFIQLYLELCATDSLCISLPFGLLENNWMSFMQKMPCFSRIMPYLKGKYNFGM